MSAHSQKPKYHADRDAFNMEIYPDIESISATAKAMVARPNIASKRFVYRQYDSMVGINNLTTNAPSDAAVVRIKGMDKGLVVTVDCNSKYVHADAYNGGAIAVSEAARNIVCTGGKPAAITNCLNFGNPYDPEVYWNFVHALKGMGDACEQFETPVTGGNVSFYNQSPNRAVNPTPTIGMLGIIEDVNKKMTLDFKAEGDSIFLLGRSYNDIASSEFLDLKHDVQLSPTPHFTLAEEAKVQSSVSTLIQEGLIQSAHDVSEGGLFITLLESAMVRNLGVEVNMVDGFRKDAYWFGEGQSRIVVSVSAEKKMMFRQRLVILACPHIELGRVQGDSMIIDGENVGTVESFKEIYDTTIEKIMES
jgi:phosphoribosylformylglycinamidine (FGAM) synthase-like enzyme